MQSILFSKTCKNMDYLNVEKVTADEETGRIIHEKILNKFCTGYVLIGEDRMAFPDEYLKYAEKVKNFEIRDDDVWIASYPKTGTTWTQEMVWMIGNGLDFEGEGKKELYSRSPFFEYSALCDRARLLEEIKVVNAKDYIDSFEQTRRLKSPRFIKTHFPFSMLPDQIRNGSKKPKIIYVMRNPKDTCVSYYHHGNLMEGWRIDLEDFTKLFLADKAEYGSYWKHIFGFWNRRDSLDILFIKYEDMKKDLRAVVKEVAAFLEKELTDKEVELLTRHLSFESMKNNETLNRVNMISRLRENGLVYKNGEFMRSGTVKKYKEELSPKTIKKLDVWIKENVVGTSFENEYDFSL